MARLRSAARKALPGKDFAGPDRSYPIEDASHARDALARSSGKPVAGRIRAAVERKYPSMKVKGGKGKRSRGDSEERHPASHAEFEKLGAKGKF